MGLLCPVYVHSTRRKGALVNDVVCLYHSRAERTSDIIQSYCSDWNQEDS